MTYLQSFITFFFILNLPNIKNHVNCYPTGAGSCDTGMAAVRDSHLTATTVRNGTLIDGNLALVTNFNTVIVPGLNVTAIFPNSNYELNIQPAFNTNVTFRGVLIRVSGPGNFTLTPGTNAQIATACTAIPDVYGVTHIDGTPKTIFSSTFRTADEGLYTIDVTVVVANNANSGSIYYYNQYKLTSFEDIPDFPTITPILNNNTMAPVAPTAVTPTAPTVPSVTVPTVPSVTLPTTTNGTMAPSGVGVTVPTPTVSAGNGTTTTTAPIASNGTSTTMAPTSVPSTTLVPSLTTVPTLILATSPTMTPSVTLVPTMDDDADNSTSTDAPVTGEMVPPTASMGTPPGSVPTVPPVTSSSYRYHYSYSTYITAVVVGTVTTLMLQH